MCGIVGLVNYRKTYPADELRRLTVAMRDAMVHRGPDDAGCWVSPDNLVCLGHRRLSIVDLRPEGRQPMGNEDGSVVVTFNGEIYNFPDLTAALQAQGHRFRSRTDTETLCHLFEEGDPVAQVQKLEGMYAFAAWNQHTRELVLARDPLGKKPLYYAVGADLIAFASELRCLEVVPGLCQSIDEVGLQQYLLLQYVHAPRTIYQHCHKLEPGCLLHVHLDGHSTFTMQQRRHFHFQPAEPAAETYRNEADADRLVEELRSQVVAAVRARLMGDVPLGAFLSGGVDSSLVVGTMVRELGIRPRTFSLGFANTTDSEHEPARRVAEHLGTDHHELLVDPSAIEMLPTIAAALDEPNGDSSCLPVYLLSQFTRGSVTVALSGDGGDELFGGYSRYTDTLHEAAKPWRHLLSLRHLRQWWSPGGAYWNRRTLTFPPHILRPLVGRFHPEVSDQLRQWHQQLRQARQPLIHRLRQCDVAMYLPGAVLAKVDRMSMQFALEVRCPLLDVRLARWAAQLPARLCNDGRHAKIILKKLAARYVPADLLDRPKMGFGLPGRTWAKEPLLNLAHDLLLGTGAKLPSFLERSGLQWYLRRAANPHAFSVYQVWSLLILEQWLRGRRWPITQMRAA